MIPQARRRDTSAGVGRAGSVVLESGAAVVRDMPSMGGLIFQKLNVLVGGGNYSFLVLRFIRPIIDLRTCDFRILKCSPLISPFCLQVNKPPLPLLPTLIVS